MKSKSILPWLTDTQFCELLEMFATARLVRHVSRQDALIFQFSNGQETDRFIFLLERLVGKEIQE